MLAESENDCYSHSLALSAHKLTEVADTHNMQMLPGTKERGLQGHATGPFCCCSQLPGVKPQPTGET